MRDNPPLTGWKSQRILTSLGIHVRHICTFIDRFVESNLYIRCVNVAKSNVSADIEFTLTKVSVVLKGLIKLEEDFKRFYNSGIWFFNLACIVFLH